MDEAAKMSELPLCTYFKALASTEEVFPQLFASDLCSFANANCISVWGDLSRKGK